MLPELHYAAQSLRLGRDAQGTMKHQDITAKIEGKIKKSRRKAQETRVVS